MTEDIDVSELEYDFSETLKSIIAEWKQYQDGGHLDSIYLKSKGLKLSDLAAKLMNLRYKK